MCISDEILFEKLCYEFEDNIEESKAYVSSDVIYELRRSAKEYSINVFTSELFSEDSMGDQGVRSDALIEANIRGNFDLLLRNAFISEQLGKYYFENYDEIDKSISHLLDALFLLSLWLGSKIQKRYVVEAGEVEINRRLKEMEDGRVGGRERAKIFLPVKVELIRLLFEKAPYKGWGSIDEAIKVIEGELFTFIEKEAREGSQNHQGDSDKTLLDWGNLDATIYRWIKEDDIIRSVFNAVIMP